LARGNTPILSTKPYGKKEERFQKEVRKHLTFQKKRQKKKEEEAAAIICV
jgi:hypothetical protein